MLIDEGIKFERFIKINKTALGVAFGVVFGIVFGSAIDNVGLGIALGIALSAALGSTIHNQGSSNEETLKKLLSHQVAGFFCL